ncbi:membrane-associated tyrosine- and threonine-specific cdc2-inhibitory kinase [Anopheles nili]|uniref:membrane-associated tyrosine- and threonine-specific cdc2-inhibitory kinase n=1 Tax=Anopheles nili TaxID=185578 RepID=UPI00237A74CB|nr:membrane-associated tyrosine- and threonine-specific cdc2-inhibitory kinase [Anopheles nili]
MRSPIPLPEMFDEDALSFSFKQPRGKNDAPHMRRPPKLLPPCNRSINASMASVISFRLDESRSELSTLYDRRKPDSYYEQCFEQLTKVGEGSFGEVFKVRSRIDGRLYAVKKSKTFFRSSHSRQVCFEEVRRYEQFSDHENCVKLYQAWEQDDRLYMQMELCRENLEVYAREHQQLQDEKIWSILLDLLLALKSLHDRDLIHLDIKLDNILVTDDGTCKLADFGIVFDLTKGNTRYAMEGDSRYMAPELMEGQYTKAADIFSLGIATLELACNLELPANGHIWQRLRSTQPLPEILSRKISPTLRTIIQSMINPKPTERPTVDKLLQHPIIRKHREVRCRRRIVLKAKTYVYRKVSSLTNFCVRVVMWLVACFRMQHRKPSASNDSRNGSQRFLRRKPTNGYRKSSLISAGCCSRSGVTLGTSRSFQDQSSDLGANDDDDLGVALDSSGCTNFGEETDPDCTSAGESPRMGMYKDSLQITPTFNNWMPPIRTPTIRIVNSTPLNHDHQHHLHYHQLQRSNNAGSRHSSRILCSPFRHLWFEEDTNDLSLGNDTSRRRNVATTNTSSPVVRSNDSDNDIHPLNSSSHDLEATVGGEEAYAVLPTLSANCDQSITSTPNCSLNKSMHSGTSAMTSSSGCDSPVSIGISTCMIKKKLRFNVEDESE